MKKALFVILGVLSVLPGYGQIPQDLWSNGGVEGTLVGITKEPTAGSRKIIVASRYAIRAWKAYDKKCLWNVRVQDHFGRPGLSADSTFFSHSGYEGGEQKIFLRRTLDGQITDSFPYEISSSTAYIAVASTTKLYVFHGGFLDEVSKESGSWNLTWRWNPGTAAYGPNADQLILHPGKRWLFACRDDNDVLVYDCTNKSSSPTATLNPPQSIRDLSLSQNGQTLLVGTSSLVYRYGIPTWSESTFGVNSLRALEFDKDGNIDALTMVSGGFRLLKLTAAGTQIASTPTIQTGADYWAWSMVNAVDGKVCSWDGSTHRVFQPTFADQGVLAPAARVTRLAAPVDDKQIFAADDEGNVIGYDMATGLRTRQFFLPGTLVHGLSAGSGRVAIATGSQTVIWNPATGGSQIIAQGANYGYDDRHVVHVSRSVVSAIGAPAVAVGDGTNVYVYNLNTGGGVRVLDAGSDVHFVQFSGGGSHLMVLTSNDQMIIWPTSSWNQPFFVDSVFGSAGAIDQSGSRVVVGLYNGGVRKYQRSGSQWNFIQEMQLGSLDHTPRQARFYKDGTKFVVASNDGGNDSMIEIVNYNPMTISQSYAVDGNATALAVTDSQQAIFFAASQYSDEDGYFRGVWNPNRLAAPWSMDLAPATVKGGNASVGRVFLSSPAPVGGVTVTLASTFPSIAQTPPQIVIPAGQKIGSFNIATSAQTVTKRITLTSTANGRSASVVINVTP